MHGWQVTAFEANVVGWKTRLGGFLQQNDPASESADPAAPLWGLDPAPKHKGALELDRSDMFCDNATSARRCWLSASQALCPTAHRDVWSVCLPVQFLLPPLTPFGHSGGLDSVAEEMTNLLASGRHVSPSVSCILQHISGHTIAQLSVIGLLFSTSVLE